MAIRAYEEEKRRAELNQKIKEDKRREAWNQKIEEDKKREEWNQKIEEMINLIQSFIQNPIFSVKTPQRVTTKVPAVTTTVLAKPIQKKQLNYKPRHGITESREARLWSDTSKIMCFCWREY
ncbi:hypothetical protein Tco_1057238 [Tanacetum coccineum]|uniref:Uncharacterized protein n=1 Tax=Tanacetum coccineum TaxID=301880 RepID=A0ABQ5H4Y2_9ASTR